MQASRSQASSVSQACPPQSSTGTFTTYLRQTHIGDNHANALHSARRRRTGCQTGLALAREAADTGAVEGMDHSGTDVSAATGNLFMATMDTMMQNMPMESSGNVDAYFLLMIIPHHQSDIDMARVELEQGQDEETRAMAQRSSTLRRPRSPKRVPCWSVWAWSPADHHGVRPTGRRQKVILWLSANQSGATSRFSMLTARIRRSPDSPLSGPARVGTGGRPPGARPRRAQRPHLPASRPCAHRRCP